MPTDPRNSDDREQLAGELRRIIALDLRGRTDATARLRRNLIAKTKRRLARNESAWLWRFLGDVYERAESARHALRRALEIDADDVEATYALCGVEFVAGRITEAAALMDRVLESELPEHIKSMAYDSAWRIYREAGRRADCRRAIRDYRRAAAACPDRHRPMGELAPEFFEDDEALVRGAAKR